MPGIGPICISCLFEYHVIGIDFNYVRKSSLVDICIIDQLRICYISHRWVHFCRVELVELFLMTSRHGSIFCIIWYCSGKPLDTIAKRRVSCVRVYGQTAGLNRPQTSRWVVCICRLRNEDILFLSSTYRTATKASLNNSLQFWISSYFAVCALNEHTRCQGVLIDAAVLPNWGPRWTMWNPRVIWIH